MSCCSAHMSIAPSADRTGLRGAAAMAGKSHVLWQEVGRSLAFAVPAWHPAPVLGMLAPAIALPPFRSIRSPSFAGAALAGASAMVSVLPSIAARAWHGQPPVVAAAAAGPHGISAAPGRYVPCEPSHCPRAAVLQWHEMKQHRVAWIDWRCAAAAALPPFNRMVNVCVCCWCIIPGASQECGG